MPREAILDSILGLLAACILLGGLWMLLTGILGMGGKKS